MSDSDAGDLAARYLRFAEDEVRGRSLLYEALARGVAADRDVIGFLMTLPGEKQQPNLLLAAVRHLFGLPVDWPWFRQTLLANRDVVGSFMRCHSTQTNEPARCATLLPVLARLPQPLALIEVGASAGLCLLPDQYGYDYSDRVVHPEAGTTRHPVFACSVNATTPLPTVMPHVVWRAGLDLNPLDVSDPSQSAWLQTLVWPEQTQRLANLQAAMEIAAIHKPRIVRGDLTGDGLARLCNEAPDGATLVVFHTAVLAYVADRAERQAFAARVTALCDYWISNEAPQVFPDATSRAGPPGWFQMKVNGSTVARTDPHGAALEWIADEAWGAV